MQCFICNCEAKERLKKGIVIYYQCSNCSTLFSGELDNSNMVGGRFELERNVNQNEIRIARINEMYAFFEKASINILDFGCGNGMLVSDLNSAGYPTDGYDSYNDKFARIPEKNKYSLITCIECVEHLSHPYYELDVMYRCLKKDGIVMFETSFVDVAEQEGINLEDYDYIEPKVGHSTIFSHHGLDLLMALKGFKPFGHINRHVRLFQKIL